MERKVFTERRVGRQRGRLVASPSPGWMLLAATLGGLAGTIVMDLFGAILFLAIGGSASLSFSIIGDAAAAFFSKVGIAVAGGFPLGVLLHYLIGLVLGVISGAAVIRVDALRIDSTLKGVGLGVLYVELMSQPLLAAAALALQMTPSETAEWYAVSFVMHLIYGGVLGVVVSFGLRSRAAAWQG